MLNNSKLDVVNINAYDVTHNAGVTFRFWHPNWILEELWLYSRTSLKTEYESSTAVVYYYSFVVGLKSLSNYSY